jgi:prepilin-type N-terminal cleavage/methylation domain-containing protein
MKNAPCQVLRDQTPMPPGAVALRLAPRVTRRAPAFSLIELLVVITILGLLAGLAVPALKDMGKSNVQISATRQLLDDVGRARQLALSQRNTIYMVFVPTNYFLMNNVNGQNFWTGLNAIPDLTKRTLALTAATNLVDKQLSGYRFISLGQLGDQPGQHAWRYLDDKWQFLPEGSFISPFKFTPQNPAIWMTVPQWPSDHPNPDYNRIFQFQRYSFPFPTEDSPPVTLPCIAFNYMGQLVPTLGNGSSLGTSDGYIPLDQGIVGYGVNPSTKSPVPTVVNPSDILERPPGNSTGIGYNIVHIDALTGRATLETFKLK